MRYCSPRVGWYYNTHNRLLRVRWLNEKRNIITVVSIMSNTHDRSFNSEKMNGNLAYCDKRLLFSILKWKYVFKVNKKASNKNTPIGFGLLKVSNKNTKKKSEIFSRLTLKTRDRRHWRRSGILLLALKRFHTLFWCFYCWLWAGKCSQVSKLNFSRWLWKHHTQ